MKFKTKREKQLEELLIKLWLENKKQIKKNNNKQAIKINQMIRLQDLKGL